MHTVARCTSENHENMNQISRKSSKGWSASRWGVVRRRCNEVKEEMNENNVVDVMDADFLIQWHHDSVTSWFSDIRTSWFSDIMVQWLHDSVTSWLHGSVTSWFSDFMIQWHHDFMIQWHHDSVTSWFSDIMIQWQSALSRFMLLLIQVLYIFQHLHSVVQAYTLHLDSVHNSEVKIQTHKRWCLRGKVITVFCRWTREE